MNVINLTPHGVHVQIDDNNVVVFAPSGNIARVSSSQNVVGNINGIPLSKNVFGGVVGLPDPVDGTVFIVSAIVADAVRRADVVSPDTGATAIRKDGQIVAVRGFVSWA